MVERSIKVKLEAETAPYKKALDDAAKATELLAAKTDHMAKRVDHATAQKKTAATQIAAAEKALKKAQDDSSTSADKLALAEEKVTKAKLDDSTATQSLNEATRALEKAQRAQTDATETQASAMKRGAAFWKENRADIDRTANSLMVVGGAGVAALGLMTKQAMSWESAWAGVTKTVNGTDAEMASLQKGLRQMATELPATHEEIAAVAESAGQLGIQTPNILKFTKTMIDLGESTNLSAEEAATGLARFMNIMGTSQNDADRLGSTIVGLGNNFATTESEILALSMRLAGAGKQAGLTEADVMSIAAAMSSVGVEAEAGGSAMSMTMKRIAKEVETGGDKLGTFAKVAGMSSEQFTTAWGENAAGALSMFVAGLADTSQMGMSASLVLDDLGIKGLREADALVRMSGAQGLMNDALGLGNKSYAENIALLTEAEARYATTESQIKMAGNAIKDAGIEVGQYVLPVLTDLASGVADVASWFASLPEPVKTVVTALGGFGSVTALAVGGTLLLVGSLSDSITAARNLAIAMPRTAAAMTKVGKVAGIAAIGVAALVAGASYKGGQSSQGLEEITAGLHDIAKGADVVDTVFKNVDDGNWFTGGKESLESLVGILSDDSGWTKFGNGAADFLTGLTRAVSFDTIDARGSIQRQRDELVAYGEQLAGMAATDLPTASDAFKALNDAAGGTDESAAGLLEVMPGLRDALFGVARDSGMATDDATLLKLALGELTPVTESAGSAADAAAAEIDSLTASLDEQAAAADEAWAAMESWVKGATSAERAKIGFEAAINAVSQSLKDNGKTLEVTTAQGQANLGTLLDIAEGGMAVIDSQRSMGASEEELQAIMQRTRDELILGYRQFHDNAEAAEAYADDLGLIPENVNTEIILGKQKAEDNMRLLKGAIEAEGMSLSPWDLKSDGKYAIAEADGVKYKIDKMTGEVSIEGRDSTATKKAQEIKDKINGTSSSIPMDAHKTAAGQAALSGFRRQIQTPVTVPIRLGAAPKASVYRAGLLAPTFATGGGVHGPGTGTSDSIPALLSNGEHVWTDAETRGAGGHGALERMRALAKAGLLPTFASGGAVAAAKKNVKAKETAVAVADKASTRASRANSDTSSKNKARKRAATLAARAAADRLKVAKAELAKAKTALVAAEKKAKADKAAADKAVAAAKKAAEVERDRKAAVAATGVEVATDIRRGSIDASSGFGAVDRLFQAGRDSNLLSGARKGLLAEASAAEKAIGGLQTQAAKAALSLAKAKDHLAEMASVKAGVGSALSQAFGLTTTAATEAGTKLVDRKDAFGNIVSDVVTTAGTAESFDAKGQEAAGVAYLAKLNRFSTALTKLADKGVPSAMLQEIVGMPLDSGIIAAEGLLSGGDATLKKIISGRADINALSSQIGSTVTRNFTTSDGTFIAGGVTDGEATVKAAEASAAAITKSLDEWGGKIEKLLGRAYGLKGYSSGGYTGDGPLDEIAGPAHREEFVINAGATKANRPLLEAINAGDLGAYARPVSVSPGPQMVAAVGGQSIDYDRLAAAFMRAQGPVTAVVSAESAQLIASSTGRSVGDAVSRGFAGAGAGIGTAVRSM